MSVSPAWSHPHHYHVAYCAERGTAGLAFGNQPVRMALPIRGPEDVNDIVRVIQEANPHLRNVAVLSWQRYEEAE